MAGAHIQLGGPNVFFLTICSKDRIPWMATKDVEDGLVNIWREEATAWHVGYYLLMPDHLHLFCAPYDLSFNIDTWITFWKRRFSTRHPAGATGWQRRSFHHRIRDRIEYEERLLYVRENPMRKGLAGDLKEWAFQGRVHDLVWTSD